MKTPQWFACWRFLTWDAKLSRRRVALWKAEALREAYGELSPDWESLNVECLRKEKRVTWALIRRNTWKKQACENCRRRVRRSEA